MKPDCWKLWDDDESASENGTPIRLSYLNGHNSHHLYFKNESDAFKFAQDHPVIDQIEIKNVKTFTTIFPKE